MEWAPLLPSDQLDSLTFNFSLDWSEITVTKGGTGQTPVNIWESGKVWDHWQHTRSVGQDRDSVSRLPYWTQLIILIRAETMSSLGFDQFWCNIRRIIGSQGEERCQNVTRSVIIWHLPLDDSVADSALYDEETHTLSLRELVWLFLTSENINYFQTGNGVVRLDWALLVVLVVRMSNCPWMMNYE